MVAGCSVRISEHIPAGQCVRFLLWRAGASRYFRSTAVDQNPLCAAKSHRFSEAQRFQPRRARMGVPARRNSRARVLAWTPNSEATSASDSPSE
jgi:hypothetical protein